MKRLRNKVFMGMYSIDETYHETEIIAMICGNGGDEYSNYYETNDIFLGEAKHPEMIGNLLFATSNQDNLEFLSEDTKIKFHKDSTNNILIKFIKTYVLPLTQEGYEEKLELYGDITPEEFVSFKNSLLRVFTNINLVSKIYGYDLKDIFNGKDKVEDFKQNYIYNNDDYKRIREMEFYPFKAIISSFGGDRYKDGLISELLKEVYENPKLENDKLIQRTIVRNKLLKLLLGIS